MVIICLIVNDFEVDPSGFFWDVTTNGEKIEVRDEVTENIPWRSHYIKKFKFTMWINERQLSSLKVSYLPFEIILGFDSF